MAKRDDTLGMSLDALAVSLIEKAQAEDTPFDQRLDAFKAISAYWLGRTKIGAKQQDDEGGSFDDFAKRIKTAEG